MQCTPQIAFTGALVLATNVLVGTVVSSMAPDHLTVEEIGELVKASQEAQTTALTSILTQHDGTNDKRERLLRELLERDVTTPEIARGLELDLIEGSTVKLDAPGTVPDGESRPQLEIQCLASDAGVDSPAPADAQANLPHLPLANQPERPLLVALEIDLPMVFVESGVAPADVLNGFIESPTPRFMQVTDSGGWIEVGGRNLVVDTETSPPIPIPASLGLLAGAVVVALWFTRRRRQ